MPPTTKAVLELPPRVISQHKMSNKIIDTVEPDSDASQSLRSQLCQKKSTVFTFCLIFYAHHVLEGVEYQYEPSCGSQHQSVPEKQVHKQEKEVFELYKTF